MDISAQGKSGKTQLLETQLTQLESRKLSLEKFEGSGYTAAAEEVVGGDIRVSEYSAPARPPALPLCRMFRGLHFPLILIFIVLNCSLTV